MLEVIRSISGANVSVYAWNSGGACPILFLFGPESSGGNGDLGEKVKAINAENKEEWGRQAMKVIWYYSAALLY